MPPLPIPPLTLLLQPLTSSFALLISVWIAVAAILALMPDAMPRVRRILACGLGLAMSTGLVSLLLARPFLTEGRLLISSLWLFGAGLALALTGVALAGLAALAAARSGGNRL